METCEIGMYYILEMGIPVWSHQYQQKITFCNDVVVKVTGETRNGKWVGEIVASNIFCDFSEDSPLLGEIEFSDEAVKCCAKTPFSDKKVVFLR